MEGWLNVTKSIGDDVFVPMATTRESTDDMGEESRSCRSVCGGVPVCHGGWLYVFLFKSFCIRILCNLEFEF